MSAVTDSNLFQKLGLKHPLIVAPMAGGPTSVDLVAAASAAGALGAMGGAYYNASAIEAFATEVRQRTDKPFSINLFIPHSIPDVAPDRVERALEATARYRQELELPSPKLEAPYEEDFDAQFEAVLRLKPACLSFVFGLLPVDHVREAKKAGIPLIGTATTLDEARALEESGVDAVTLQGFEAGGHRGIFDARAADPEIGLRDLLAQCVGIIRVPLIAAGGIMTAGDIRAALLAGARAVQMGTAFLACTEAGTSAPYRKKLLETPERRTRTTRAFSGRFARGLENRFMDEMDAKPDAILPFPAQNKFTRDMRGASTAKGLPDFLSLWSGTGKGELWRGGTADLIDLLFAE
ncbi:NAD(P)H-dependent flavin oxidoreductase [Rhizobium sp. NPDC090279]|uniref:NAD(P)H-dependent flavin oxidoreductase n=1 Tax=Rhizobium sp. NPDC090279 TaxID=3364499 RepID=UPI00383AFF70